MKRACLSSTKKGNQSFLLDICTQPVCLFRPFFKKKKEKKNLSVLTIFVGHFGLIVCPEFILEVAPYIPNRETTFGNSSFGWDVLGHLNSKCGHISTKVGKTLSHWDSTNLKILVNSVKCHKMSCMVTDKTNVFSELKWKQPASSLTSGISVGLRTSLHNCGYHFLTEVGVSGEDV